MILINPGSNIAEESKDKKWTNTHEMAVEHCRNWFLKPMLDAGFEDIEFTDTGKYEEGRWVFEFKHLITGVVVEAEVHGISPLSEYKKENIFTPRTYWKGSSCADPEIKDFAKEGFKPVMTYKPNSDNSLDKRSK